MPWLNDRPILKGSPTPGSRSMARSVKNRNGAWPLLQSLCFVTSPTVRNNVVLNGSKATNQIRPFATLLTLTQVPNGKVRWAAAPQKPPAIDGELGRPCTIGLVDLAKELCAHAG